MNAHTVLIVVYLAVVLPPLAWLLGAVYVMLWRETRRTIRRGN